jgi:hypothetical protein
MKTRPARYLWPIIPVSGTQAACEAMFILHRFAGQGHNRNRHYFQRITNPFPGKIIF